MKVGFIFARVDCNIAKLYCNNLQSAKADFNKWTGIMCYLLLKPGQEVIYGQKHCYIKAPLSLETVLVEEIGTGSLYTAKLSELSSLDNEIEQNIVSDISLIPEKNGLRQS